MTTAIIGVKNRDEARIAGHRQKARLELRAIEGRPPTSRNRRTGYTKGYKAINWEEAKWLRRAMKKVIAGQSLSGIIREMTAEGITRQDGKQYRNTDLGRLLRDPIYAGLRTYGADMEVNGEIIPKGEVVATGQWARIFTTEEHRQLRAILDENEPWVTNRSPKHLLIGALACAECGTKMAKTWNLGKAHKDGTRVRRYHYRCQRATGGCGIVARNSDALENFFIDLTVNALKRLPKVEKKTETDTSSAGIAREQRKIADALKAFNDDEIDIGEFATIKKIARKKIDAFRKEQQATKKLPTSLIDSPESFLACDDIILRRDTIRKLFGIVGVKKVGRGMRFNPDQLVFSEKLVADVVAA